MIKEDIGWERIAGEFSMAIIWGVYLVFLLNWSVQISQRVRNRDHDCPY